MRYINLFRTTLQQKLTAGTATSTIKIQDLPPDVTSGALLISSAGVPSPFEIISFTGVDSGSGTITGVTRGIKQNATGSTDNDATRMLSWARGASVVQIVPNYDLNDIVRASDDVSLSDDLSIGGNLTFTGTTKLGLHLRSLTTTQRDAATAANGALIYNSTAGEVQMYLAGSWYTMAAGSTQPNASPTAAGKVEISTLAQGKAGTATGETGAYIVLSPADMQTILQSQESINGTTGGTSTAYTLTLTPALSAYTSGQSFLIKFHTACGNNPTLNINGLGAKNIVKGASTNLKSNDILANEYHRVFYDGTNIVLNSPSALRKASDTFNRNTIFGGSGADGAISGALTIAGSNNTLIEKNYTTFTPGSNTVTVTPTGCVVYIRVSGDADLSNTTFNFTGKGIPGGTGGTAGSSGHGAGGDGAKPAQTPVIIRQTASGFGTGGSGSAGTTAGGGGGAGASSFEAVGSNGSNGAVSGGTAGVGGTAADAGAFPIAATLARNGYHVSPGLGGSGGGGGKGGTGGAAPGGAGGAGGAGGGCLILEVAGNLTLSSTTFSFGGSNGSNGAAGTSDGSGGGGGGGGAGGQCLVIYGGTLSGSSTPTVTGGSAGSAGGTGSGSIGGAGGAGGAGGYAFIQNNKLV